MQRVSASTLWEDARDEFHGRPAKSVGIIAGINVHRELNTVRRGGNCGDVGGLVSQ